MEEEIIKNYGVVGSDYLINYRIKNRLEYKLVNNVLSKRYTIQTFETSKEYNEIKKQYGNVKIQLKVSNPLNNIILNVGNMKYYDSDENEIIIRDKNKYTVHYISILNENNNIERLTLNEYIESVRKVKELQRYKHYLRMDYNNDEVEIIFGENKVIVTDGNDEISEDDFIFEKYVDEIWLRMD